MPPNIPTQPPVNHHPADPSGAHGAHGAHAGQPQQSQQPIASPQPQGHPTRPVVRHVPEQVAQHTSPNPYVSPTTPPYGRTVEAVLAEQQAGARADAAFLVRSLRQLATRATLGADLLEQTGGEAVFHDSFTHGQTLSDAALAATAGIKHLQQRLELLRSLEHILRRLAVPHAAAPRPEPPAVGE